MQMGFISLLLTIVQVPISKICVGKAVGNSFLPCNDLDLSLETAVAYDDSGLNTTTPFEETVNDDSCEMKVREKHT